MTQPVLCLALAALAATAFAAPALAQDELEPAGGDGGLDVSATVTGVSDYRFRGVSSSDRDPAIQGSIDLNFRGFYVGAWASSIARTACVFAIRDAPPSLLATRSDHSKPLRRNSPCPSGAAKMLSAESDR